MANRILAGRYELLEKIGEGGMAVVFKSRDRLLNRLVAIKILRPEYTKDSLFIESFKNESQLAASIVHPNIVNIYDVGKQGNIYYIVMELIEGEPLSTIIAREGALEPRRAVKIAKEVASALSTAHKHQLIHRDVKPHNIMITKDGTAKITDFGIAKQVSQDTFVGEQQSAVMGSVHYFSPEQARGGYVDERSDIYSLGIVLYEMVTGKVPYDGETAVEVAVKHMNEEMVPPSEINPNVPADLEEIILKATDKLQVNRYKNADEMITALNFIKFSRIVGSKAEEGEAAASVIKAHDGDRQKDGEEAQGSEADGEEKKGDDKDAKKKLLIQIAIAILLALLLAFPVSSLVARMIKNVSETVKPPENVTVPKVVGLDYDEAERQLAQIGLKITKQNTVRSADFAPNQITTQSPSEGTTVKEGQSVKVTVNAGEAVKAVPSVVNESYANARYKLESMGFKIGEVKYVPNEDIETNWVISQNPAAGSSMSDGTSVDLVVSKGKEIKVDLSNMTEAEAKTLLEELGLSLGVVSQDYSDTIKEGRICDQNPDKDTVLSEGQSVDIVISMGKEPEPEKPPVEETPTEPAVTDPVQGGETKPDDGQGSQGGQDSQGGETKPDDGVDSRYELKSVAIPVDLSKATEDEFELKVNVNDGIGDPRTLIENVHKSEGSKILSVSGRGPNGRVVVRFGNVVMYQYSVNFETGEVL
jgi:serine/threonine-protein kinase